jgi:hypothetical protein
MEVLEQDCGKPSSWTIRIYCYEFKICVLCRAVQDAMNLLQSSDTARDRTMPTASHLGLDVIHGSRHILELAKSLTGGM